MWYINWPEETRVKLVCGHAGEVVGVATSSSEDPLLATCCRDGSVAVWNLERLEQKVVFLAPKKVSLASWSGSYSNSSVFPKAKCPTSIS